MRLPSSTPRPGATPARAAPALQAHPHLSAHPRHPRREGQGRSTLATVKRNALGGNPTHARSNLPSSRLAPCAATGTNAPAPAPLPLPSVRLPISPGDQADQAAAAILAAHADGATRVRVELLLPITGATDLDDWPGGVRMQAKAAMPLVERLLAAVRRGAQGLSGRLDSRVLDEGDAVC